MECENIFTESMQKVKFQFTANSHFLKITRYNIVVQS